ncbi:unnamed protein product, partial [Rotaria sp. Silwood1]
MAGDKAPALKMMALDRPFKVGMLYDYKTDRLIPNMLLWDEKLISNYLTCHSSSSRTYEVHINNNLTELEYLFGIDNNLKLSILAGLVDLPGSNNLIDYCQRIKQTERFILQYSITTHSDELAIRHFRKSDVKHQDLFHQRVATHVVTDVFYGIEIFFVFNRKLSDNENRTELHNSVKELLKKLTTLPISDIGQLHLSNGEKQLAETLTCQYYGDIQLKSNPTSFIEAIELLRQLPNLLGKNNENTKPIKVLLYPLYLLDDFATAKKRFHEINNHILSKSVEHMTSLHELVISLSDIKSNLSSLKIFYQTEQQLSRICTRMSEIETDIRKEMVKLLPEVRGTSLQEKSLTDLLEKFNFSLSTKQKLNDWIQFKTEEKNIFTSFINDLRKQDNINLLTFPFAEVRKNFNHKFILRLIIHVTEENDTFLNELLQYLEDYSKRDHDTNIKINRWFNQNNLALIQKQITLFIKFAEINVNKNNIVFVVDEEDINKFQRKKGVTTILYQNGVPMNFEIPSRPGRPHVTDNSCQNTTLSWTKPAQGSENIQQYMIYGRNHLNRHWKLLLSTVNDTPSAIISNLEEGKYRFKIQGITLAGYTEESDACDAIADIVDRLSTENFLSNERLSSEEKYYYEECKEYYQLTKQPLISVSDEILDSTIELQSSSIKLGIDEDCHKFDLRDFLKKFCDTLNLEINDISVQKIQAGSAILEATIYDKLKSSNKKTRLKMICNKLTDKLQTQLAQMNIFFLFMGSIESLHKIQKYRAEIKLNPEYNRIYARGYNYWVGALNDGIDRGNQPYYCPVGWQRWSFYVTEYFYEKFKGWCTCYHGTKFVYALSILLSGLKPAVADEHGDGIYVTPSINYASHPRYSEVKFIEASSQKLVFKSGEYVQFVLECRVHPKYIKKIAKETLDASNTTIDSNITNDIIEWVIDHQNKSIVDFNDPNASIICSGLMIRVTDDHPGLLPQSQWWHKSHLCNKSSCCALGIDLNRLKGKNQRGDKCKRLTMYQMEQFLPHLPHLKHFVFQAYATAEICDGYRWQLLTSSLITFNFKFHASLVLSEQTLDSFRSTFWLEEKRWFVAYQEHYLFSIPYFAPSDAAIPYKSSVYFTAPDNSVIYDHVTKVVVTKVPIQIS